MIDPFSADLKLTNVSLSFSELIKAAVTLIEMSGPQALIPGAKASLL